MKENALKVEHISKEKQHKKISSGGKLVNLYNDFVHKTALRQSYTKIMYASIAPDLILAVTSGVTGYNIGVSFGLNNTWCMATAFATAACIDGILAIYKESAQEKAHAGDLEPKTIKWFSSMVVIFFLYGLTATASLLSNGFIKDSYVESKKVSIEKRTELIEGAIAANQIESITEDPLLTSWNRQLEKLEEEKQTMLKQTTDYIRRQYLAGSIDSKINKCEDCHTLRAFSATISKKDSEISELQKKINDFAYQSKMDQSAAKYQVVEMVNGDIEKKNSDAEKAGNRLSVFLVFLEPTLALLSFLLFTLKVEKRREQGINGIEIKESITVQAIIDRIKIPFDRAAAHVAIQNQELNTRLAVNAGGSIDKQNPSPSSKKRSVQSASRVHYARAPAPACVPAHPHPRTRTREKIKKGDRIECKGCGEIFVAKGPRNKYCSNECREN